MGEKGGLFKGLAILGAVVLALACCGMLLTLCERPAAAMERCAGVVCKLRGGCWPRNPTTGTFVAIKGLVRGAFACAGHSKVLVLRNWRGHPYELSLMELPGMHDAKGEMLWYRLSDFRLAGTP
jgi:hypothetical protein